MDYINIFPTTLGTKTLNYIPDKYISKCKEYILNSPLEPLKDKKLNDFATKDKSLLESQIFKNLKKDILHYSKKYVDYIGITVEDLQISKSWAVIVNPNNNLNNYHSHKNSLISGCFYLTYGGDINFKSSFYEDLYYFTAPNNENQFSQHYFPLNIEKKLLVLFPSNLVHAVSFNDKINRITIAFDIIPKGKFGPSNSETLFK